MDTKNVISFHYTLRDPAGRVLDTSEGGEPLTYLSGSGQIIDGLDEALRDLPAGARQQVTVPAARAYGEHDASQVQSVPRSALPVEGELRVGDRFQAGPDRHAPIVTVVEVGEEEVRLDGNHPLAGVDLTFDVEIVAVRAATDDEVEHGHAHGAGGCGH
jgi:FKBP-type peptidyl-prolyl cis-trans isomerase SlyD